MQETAEEAKGHLEAFLWLATFPIPALMVLGWAMITGEDQLVVFDLKLSVETASLLIGLLVAVLLFASARSLFALLLLLQDDAQTCAAKKAIQGHTSPLNPFFLARAEFHPGTIGNKVARGFIERFGSPIITFINNFGGFIIGFLLGTELYIDLFVSAGVLNKLVYLSKGAAILVLLVAFTTIVWHLGRWKAVGSALLVGLFISWVLAVLMAAAG